MSNDPIHDVIQYVTGLTSPERTILVAIDGSAGAGKTTSTKWLVERIRENLTPVSIVFTELIYRPVADRWQGFIEDMPISRCK